MIHFTSCLSHLHMNSPPTKTAVVFVATAMHPAILVLIPLLPAIMLYMVQGDIPQCFDKMLGLIFNLRKYTNNKFSGNIVPGSAIKTAFEIGTGSNLWRLTFIPFAFLNADALLIFSL